MSDEHDHLPADPFGSHDAERIAKEQGGAIVAALMRAHEDRLTIGAYEHPHKMKSLNVVTIRMWRDGKQTDGVDLDQAEVQHMIAALLQAITICWGTPPSTTLEQT